GASEHAASSARSAKRVECLRMSVDRGRAREHKLCRASSHRMTQRPRLFDRRAKEAAEARELVPAALKSAESAGRKFPEEEDDLRTCWERDRDRIVHCTG